MIEIADLPVVFTISADPGLGQGRGGAWDHRRCGTSPSSLSKVKPISQPASRRKATSRKHFPGMLRPPVKTSRHLDMKITCFGQVSFPPDGFVWRFCLSSPKQPFPHSCSSSSNHWPRLKRLKPLKTLTTLTWLASSCSQQPPRGHTSMASYGPLKQSLGMLHPAANRHPKATHQWLLMGRLNNPLACFIL